MATLDSEGPSDISDLLAKHIRTDRQPDGSYFVAAQIDGACNEALEHSLQLTVVHRLGLGRWLVGPISEPHDEHTWAWGGQYLPEDITVPDDLSAVQGMT
jgi:hypothetical protein